MNRLILFDIDGTLVTGGPAKLAFHRAMVAVYGTAGPIEDHEFSGKTDPQIARELLTRAGLLPERIEDGFSALWERYLEELELRLADHPMLQLPGVQGLLDDLAGRSEVALGLVTGNLARGAELKLGSVGLGSRFAVGAFGCDHEVRGRLPAVALRRAREAWGVDFPPDRVIVVGDTPRDVACGREHGTRTLAVATGNFSRSQLAEAGADHVLADFTRTPEVVELLLD